MKVLTSLKNFSEILSFLSKFQAKDFQDFSLEATKDCLSGTYLTPFCGLRIKEQAEVKEPGRFNLGMLGLLSKALRNFENGDLLLERNGSNLLLKSGYFLWSLNETLNEVNLPKIDFHQEPIILPSMTFKKSLSNSLPFVGGPMDLAILFDCRETELRIIACDGHRLNFLGLPVEKGAPWKKLLPSSILSILKKVLPEEGEIKLRPLERFLSVSFDDTLIVLSTLEESYLNYSKIMKRDTGFRSFKIRTVSLCQALSAISNFSDGVKFELNRNRLKLRASSELGTFEFQVRGESSFENFSICFNPYYFLQAVKSFEGVEELELFFKSPEEKCVIKGLSGEKHLHFLMPIIREGI
jgi:DNA polymerase III sliding clamp (beta) subunit (PCNA family)